jgi:hypothetical protein
VLRNTSFVDVFAKLRKATISFVLSFRLHGYHWTDFYEVRYSNIFRKSIEEFQVLLKSDKNNGYFTGTDRQCTFMIISR